MHLLNALPQRLDPSATPTFAGLIAPSLTSPASTNLTLGTGSFGTALTVASATGNVGIGTTGPGYQLNLSKGTGVQSDLGITSGASSFVFGSRDVNSGRSAISYTNNAGGADNIISLGFGAITAGVPANPVMTLNQASNVGIGTTDMTGLTGSGGLKIASTTAGSSGAGALVVAGGLATGAASYFGGAVTIAGNISLSTDGSKFLSAAGTTYFVPASGNTGQTVRIAPLGTSTDAMLYVYGQASDTVGARFEFNQSGQNSIIRNQVMGGSSQGTIVLENGGTAMTIEANKDATFAGTVIAPAATVSLAPLRIPHGTAPTSPTNGDMWTTTAGLFIRINGATVGPLS